MSLSMGPIYGKAFRPYTRRRRCLAILPPNQPSKHHPLSARQNEVRLGERDNVWQDQTAASSVRPSGLFAGVVSIKPRPPHQNAHNIWLATYAKPIWEYNPVAAP